MYIAKNLAFTSKPSPTPVYLSILTFESVKSWLHPSRQSYLNFQFLGWISSRLFLVIVRACFHSNFTRPCAFCRWNDTCASRTFRRDLSFSFCVAGFLFSRKKLRAVFVQALYLFSAFSDSPGLGYVSWNMYNACAKSRQFTKQILKRRMLM